MLPNVQSHGLKHTTKNNTRHERNSRDLGLGAPCISENVSAKKCSHRCHSARLLCPQNGGASYGGGAPRFSEVLHVILKISMFLVSPN